MSFTEQTSSLSNETELCRQVAKLASETFQVLSLTIWLIDENQRLVFGASTSLAGKESNNPVHDEGRIAALIEGMREHAQPVNIDESDADWVETLKSCNPDFFHRGGNRICMPLVAQNEVLGFISLGDRVNALPFSTEENDLLKCVGDQVAASLLSLRLSRKLLRAKELEALQTMSAFFVHDLKNTAHSLSLLLQNLTAHFHDPAFREDARRAVSNSVSHLNEVIGRLSLLRQNLELHLSEVNLSAVVDAAIENIHLPPNEPLQKRLHPAALVLADPEQIRKVVVNLILNAREAAGTDRRIEVATDVQQRWAVLSVRDYGCGMSPEFIAKFLFRPFQTTKKTGLGIGMFHSKAIIEAHRGKIEIESELQKGTTVRIFLPLKGK
jgi:putative PEP-CTERM system histidine kinase